MIKLFRIDERLIHGQVAIKWSRHTDVDHIVVANDHAASSEIMQKTLKMAAPAGIKTAIKSVSDAITLLNDSRCEAFKILVLVNCPEDALRMTQSISGIPYINVGNYGRVAPEKPDMPRKKYGKNIYCDDIEVDAFKKLLNSGLKCVYQTTPENTAEDLERIFL